MQAIELRLLTKMLHEGNFNPIIDGAIDLSHFETDLGKIIFNFIATYAQQTDGEVKWPSLAIVKHRVNGAAELVDPDPGDTVHALVYETQRQRQKSRIRQLAMDLQTMSTSSDNPVEELPAYIGALKTITESTKNTKHASLCDSIEDVLINYESGSILPDGVPWPWASMQKATRGIHEKEFIVLSGRPKTRKTFLALFILSYAFKYHNERVLIFSPEMPRMQVLLRVVAMLADLRYSEFKNSALDDAERMRLLEVAKRYIKYSTEADSEYHARLTLNVGGDPERPPSLDIVESAGKPISWMQTQIEMYRPKIVLCDSFYRQPTDASRKNDTEQARVTLASRALKDLAMTTGTAIFGTHQINREGNKSVGDLSNLSFTDAVSQDADLILRAITQNVDGKGRTALVVLGGREVPFEGIFINNEPCVDFTEIGPIENRKTVEKWMANDEDKESKEEAKKFENQRTIKKPSMASKAAENVDKTEEQLADRTAALDEATSDPE